MPKDPESSNLPYRLTLLIVGILAVFLVFQSAERLRGYLLFSQVKELKGKWYNNSLVPHDQELNEAFKLGYRAVEYEEENADYRFILASLHAWREKGLRLWPDQARSENKIIIQSLKAALVRRPSWSEAWIFLALVKYQSGEIDHELRVALEKAIETGQYETSVQHGLSYVAPRIWDKLEPRLLQETIATIRIALNNPDVKEFVVEQLVMSGKLEDFKNQLEADDRLKRLMNRFEEKRKEAL